MSPSFSQIIGIARSGMQSRMLDLDSISNNLANIHTNGYKSTRLNFQELLDGQALNGVQPAASQVSQLQGSIETTGNALDLAVEGAGYFSVKLQNGKTGYTRDGHFTQDGSGKVVNMDGYPLVWTGTIPADTEGIEVQPDGAVMAKVGSTWTNVGKINLTTFPNASGLTSFGENMYLESDVSGKAKTGAAASTGFGLIHGYSLEKSNINLSNEFARMVRMQRAFETAVSALKKTDEMISLAIRVR
ncbi:MAG: flagellar hook-basal body protein [Anaerolineaceae bacterium]